MPHAVAANPDLQHLHLHMPAYPNILRPQFLVFFIIIFRFTEEPTIGF